MDFWTLIAIAFIMGIVTGALSFKGYHAGKKRQGAKFELDSSREALHQVDLGLLSSRGREAVMRYVQTQLHIDNAKRQKVEANKRKWQARES